jgi:DHA2 family multidrug resistance protein
MFGPIIGPALGGWITDNMSWRWIFYINIPIGIIAVVMNTFFIFDPSYLKRVRASIDYWGLTLLVVGLGALQIVLDKGQEEDWFNSPFILVFSAVAVLTLLALIYVELTHPHPIVNLRLFKNVSFAAGNFIMFAVGFCLYSSIMLIPLLLQTLMGYNATMAGMVLAPGGVATLVCMPFVGAFIQRYDGRKVVFCGLAIGAVSMFIMQHFSLQAAYRDFVWPRVVLGVGLAMTFVPLTTLTLSTIAKIEMGNATGIYSLLRNIGGSVGIAISATLLQRYAQFYQTSLVANVTPYNPTVQSRLAMMKSANIARGIDPVAAEKSALAMIYGSIRQQSYMLAYNRIFFIVGIAFLVIIPLLLLLKKPQKHAPPTAAH